MSEAAVADPAGLAAAGLDPDEVAAYELLLARPLSTLPELAKSWTGHAPLDTALATLEAKGFLTHEDGVEQRYAAVDPDIALETPLADYEAQLRQAREHVHRLAHAYRSRTTAGNGATLIEVVTGHRAVVQRVAQLQRGAREEICSLDRPPYLDGPGTVGTDLGMPARGIICRTIYERASVEHPGNWRDVEGCSPPASEPGSCPRCRWQLYLVDRRHAVLPLQSEPASVEAAPSSTHPPCSTRSASFFDGLWERATPLALPAGLATATGRRTSMDEHSLVTLLLSGLTDQAIARQLGIGYRTVQRHIAALMNRLGAHTRFQAGVQAAVQRQSAFAEPAEEASEDAARSR